MFCWIYAKFFKFFLHLNSMGFGEKNTSLKPIFFAVCKKLV